MTKTLIEEDVIIERIRKAFESLDGEEISEIHNKICSGHLSYAGDSVWELED